MEPVLNSLRMYFLAMPNGQTKYMEENRYEVTTSLNSLRYLLLENSRVEDLEEGQDGFQIINKLLVIYEFVLDFEVVRQMSGNSTIISSTNLNVDSITSHLDDVQKYFKLRGIK